MRSVMSDSLGVCSRLTEQREIVGRAGGVAWGGVRCRRILQSTPCTKPLFEARCGLLSCRSLVGRGGLASACFRHAVPVVGPSHPMSPIRSPEQ